MYSKKFKPAGYFIALIFAAVSSTSGCIIDEYLPYLTMLKLFISIILPMAMIIFVFKFSYVRSFLMSCLMNIVMGIANVFTILILNFVGMDISINNLLNNPRLLMVGDAITIIIAVIIMIFIYYNKNYYNTVSSNTRKAYLAVIVSTFMMLATNFGIYFILLRDYHLKSWFFISITLLITVYCVFMLYAARKFQFYGTKETELEQQQFYNSILKNSLYGLRRFKHDYNNKLSVMHSMLKKKQYNELEMYMEEILVINDWINMENTMLNIGNAALYGLLISKFKYAENLNVKIDLKVTGEIIDIQYIKMVELCELLGIIVDNSLEAVTGKDNNEVYIEILDFEQFLKFKVENFFEGGQETFNKIRLGGYTTKGEGRGNGILIVRNIIKGNKYVNYNINLFPERKIICQEVIINKA